MHQGPSERMHAASPLACTAAAPSFGLRHCNSTKGQGWVGRMHKHGVGGAVESWEGSARIQQLAQGGKRETRWRHQRLCRRRTASAVPFQQRRLHCSDPRCHLLCRIKHIQDSHGRQARPPGEQGQLKAGGRGTLPALACPSRLDWSPLKAPWICAHRCYRACAGPHWRPGEVTTVAGSSGCNAFCAAVNECSAGIGEGRPSGEGPQAQEDQQGWPHPASRGLVSAVAAMVEPLWM